MTYAEFQESYEAAMRSELERLSILSTPELIRRIERREFGNYQQAFAALASKKDLRLAGPFLANQLLRERLSFAERLGCATALLSMLPYSGIPAHALADPRHPGHSIYTEDLEAHLANTLRKLEDGAALTPRPQSLPPGT
jgi:hypothetical protein